MKTSPKVVTYYAATGAPGGRGWIELLVTHSGPGRFDQVPTGTVYPTTRDMQRGLSERNALPR